MGIGYQKSVTCKMYPEEIEALEIVTKLAGWSGKSEALREFSKIWIEAAVVTLDTKSATRGTWQIVKSMQRLQEQMRQIEKNAKKEDTNLLREHDLEVLRKAIA